MSYGRSGLLALSLGCLQVRFQLLAEQEEPVDLGGDANLLLNRGEANRPPLHLGLRHVEHGQPVGLAANLIGEVLEDVEEEPLVHGLREDQLPDVVVVDRMGSLPDVRAEARRPREQQVARNQLRQIVHYAESAGCRRAELLAYFGETFPGSNCGACDNCLEPRETYDGTIAAQKFLSCIYRIKQATRFSVGLNHIVEVLTGADTEKIRRWGHDRLSTYGIGKEFNRSQWAAVGRELMRLGHVGVAEGEYSTLELTDSGMDLLRSRAPVTLTKPLDLPVAKRVTRRTGDIACDEILFAHLRGVRKKLADERKVPAYVIFGDATLRAMAREYPVTIQDMSGIFGMGEKKLAEYGPIFTAAIAEFLETNSQQTFD